MKKNWKYFFSPCKVCAIIALVLMLVAVARMEATSGWSIFMVFELLPVVLILLGIDWAIKMIIGDNTKMVWLTEVIVMVVLVCVFDEKAGLISALLRGL